MGNLFDFNGVRIGQDPVIDVQMNDDPTVTRLVVGTPQRLPFVGDKLIMPIRVPKFSFEYWTFNTEHLDTYQTKRAMRAPIKHGDWTATTISDRLERYSFRVLKDADEIGNAHPRLRIRQRSAELARRIVTMDIEREIRDMVIDSANYPVAHVQTLGAGSEWNSAGGDSRANVRALMSQIISAIPVMPEDLIMFLPLASLEAALDDPQFLAARHNFSTDTAGPDALARYWGIGRVWSGNPVDKDETTGVVGPMYPDVAILYYPGEGASFDTTYGDITWAVNFKLNMGVASKAWYDDLHTAWSFPWHDYAAPRIINRNAAGLIENTVA